MDPIDPFNPTLYVPYFYQSGLHQRYGFDDSRRVARTANEIPTSRATTHSSELDFPQTIEQIVQRGYFAVLRRDPITALLADRADSSWLGLDDVVTQIRRRYEIHGENMERIERAKCAASNAIYQHEAYAGPPTSKQMYGRHKAIQGLYEEQRSERVALWKDVSRLRTTLPEITQQYMAAYRKRSILESDGGDAE